MKITKLGHCCLIIEVEGLKILTDPGSFTDAQNEIKNIDVVLITHEHGDHLHVPSVKAILANNPQAQVITNQGVGKILEKEGIKHQIVDGKSTTTIKGVLIESCDHRHEEIYQDYGQVQNTGYFIAKKLFYPGDAFANPGKPVDILALPAAGPWMKVSQAINYAKEIKPRVCFPVHDAMIVPSAHFALHLFEVFLTPEHIKFIPIVIGEETEF